VWERDNHQPASNKKLERERKMCSLVIIVWTENMKDEEQICKQKSACELSVLLFLCDNP
jgi:hypothetical protein